MSTPLFQRLYLRIWLAVVATIAVVTLVAGWLGSQEAQRERANRPVREITIRNSEGVELGNASARPTLVAGQGAEFLVPMKDGSSLIVQFSRPPRPMGSMGQMGSMGPPDGGPGRPGFERPPGAGRPGGKPANVSPWPFNFVWMLVALAIAVALGTYPIVRRLTKRLETAQAGVERWGAGDFSARLDETGRDEVAFLAKRFNHSAERIEQLLAEQKALLVSQKSLLANASHELRSPLARIRMGLELMKPAASAEKYQTDLVVEINRNITELDQLVEEILLASRLDAKETDLGTIERVDLLGLAAEECASFEVELDIGLPSNEPPPPAWMVQGVVKLLRRALRNLLENARRYAGGAVSVSLRRQGEWVLLQVCDGGPGVPEAYQTRIFEGFFRLPGSSERDGGVGLGLALVKSIVTRHGGTVSCSNRPQGGACFEIRLPLVAID